MASKKLQSIIKEDEKYLFQNYGRRKNVCFVKGKGSLLYDQDGKEYIDLFAGVAVCALGYGHKAHIAAIKKQAETLIHSSNHFYNKEQSEAGRLIAELSFAGKTLFGNSGTEANEAAIKLARKFGLARSKRKYEIISFVNSFHGRTYGSMTATGQAKIHDGFGPLPAGFTYLPFNNIKEFAKAMRKSGQIAAVMIELVQGEGGVTPAEADFTAELAAICKKNDVLLIIDEIQTGAGRTGKAFAYQHYGIEPDIITIAKGLGGGIPIGAMHARDYLNEYLPAGSHGTTFGGNHFACAAACAVLRELQKPTFLKTAAKTGELMMNALSAGAEKLGYSKPRGLGMLIGQELPYPASHIVDKALERGVVINCTAGNVIRIAPPLNIPYALALKGIKIIEEIFAEEADR